MLMHLGLSLHDPEQIHNQQVKSVSCRFRNSLVTYFISKELLSLSLNQGHERDQSKTKCLLLLRLWSWSGSSPAPADGLIWLQKTDPIPFQVSCCFHPLISHLNVFAYSSAVSFCSYALFKADCCSKSEYYTEHLHIFLFDSLNYWIFIFFVSFGSSSSGWLRSHRGHRKQRVVYLLSVRRPRAVSQQLLDGDPVVQDPAVPLLHDLLLAQ